MFKKLFSILFKDASKVKKKKEPINGSDIDKTIKRIVYEELDVNCEMTDNIISDIKMDSLDISSFLLNIESEFSIEFEEHYYQYVIDDDCSLNEIKAEIINLTLS